jgi:divalent metal cation (Fe/Co/Zn/Cd) transporter
MLQVVSSLTIIILMTLEASFIIYKSFTIVIYDHNDSSQYYNTMIMIVSYSPNLTLALASVVNYDCK